MEQRDAAVAVIGLGAIGAHALWRLAARGVDAIGIEQFEPGHPRGGSTGETRLFRVACLEHPGLVPIARRSRELWRELEAESGESLLVETGAIMIGQPGSRIIAGTLAAAAAHGLPVERLTAEDIADRFPGHARLDEGDVGLWDPEAGIARPEAAIVAAARAAVEAGARIRTGERVVAIEPDANGVTLRLEPAAAASARPGADAEHGDARGSASPRSLRVDSVIVASGPWLAQHTSLPVTPHRVVMTWFRAREGRDASLERLPVFIRSVPGSAANGSGGTWIWGHGASAPGAAHSFDVKVGPEFDGPFEADDPDAIDRTVQAGETDGIRDLVAATFPDVEPEPIAATTCIMAHTPDGQFVLGRVPAVAGAEAHDRVIAAGGCSGHSFKHAAALGDLSAQLAAGVEPDLDIAFLDPRRWARGS